MGSPAEGARLPPILPGATTFTVMPSAANSVARQCIMPTEPILPAETWFVISSILAPIGYVIQDVVADAMTVEVVESKSNNKRCY